MKNLKTFLWASRHSPEFRNCQFFWPLDARIVPGRASGSIMLEITLRSPRFYLPYSVLDSYERAMNPEIQLYEDIPF